MPCQNGPPSRLVWCTCSTSRLQLCASQWGPSAYGSTGCNSSKPEFYYAIHSTHLDLFLVSSMPRSMSGGWGSNNQMNVLQILIWMSTRDMSTHSKLSRRSSPLPTIWLWWVTYMQGEFVNYWMGCCSSYLIVMVVPFQRMLWVSPSPALISTALKTEHIHWRFQQPSSWTHC